MNQIFRSTTGMSVLTNTVKYCWQCKKIYIYIYNTSKIKTTTTSGDRVAYFSYITWVVILSSNVTIPAFSNFFE